MAATEQTNETASTKGIRIAAIPPGFAPEDVRKEWIGVTIPFPSEKTLREYPVSSIGFGNENIGGYVVLRDTAIDALIAAEKYEAALYWLNIPLGIYLEFRKDVCQLIENAAVTPLPSTKIREQVIELITHNESERLLIQAANGRIANNDRLIKALQKQCPHKHTTERSEDDVNTIKIRTYCTDCGARVFKD